MPNKTIAVISASGFLGEKLADTFKRNGYNVKATFFPKKEGHQGPELDVTKQEKVNQFVESVSPAAVINCSAITAVDWCESHREQCFEVNLLGTKNLAIACKAAKSKLVHVSTAFVFDGSKAQKYSEQDKVNPVNVYSESKAESEKAVLETLNDFLILRTTDLYGFNSKQDKNFVTWVLQNLRSGKQFGVVNDQFSQPCLIDDLALACLRLLQLNKKGIFHVFGSDYISKYQFALLVARTFGFDASLIKPIPTSQSPMKAKRPMLLPMNTEKAAALGIRPRTVAKGLLLMQKQMQQSQN